MLKILILEDEPILGKHVRRHLSRRGHSVELTSTVESFVDEASKRSFELCLIDLALPDGNGLEAWERVRELQPMARALLMTAFHTPQVEGDAYRAGFESVLPKPLSFDSLASRIAGSADQSLEMLGSESA